MQGPRVGVVIFVAALFVCVPNAPSYAETPETPPAVTLLAGSYRYAGNWAEDEAKIQASVETAISNLGWLGRRVADSRLSSHRKRPTRVVIARTGDNLSVTMNDYEAIAPLSGQPRDVIAPNNRDSKLSYKFAADTILQFFAGEHAKRKSTYSLNERGQLVMTVTMTSEKLAGPIEYALVYDRQP
ncbi:MAG: hypothetical protein AAF997_04590 [Myxococcota bacterium]